jgi:sugar fermentation stimulation protein A
MRGADRRGERDVTAAAGPGRFFGPTERAVFLAREDEDRGCYLLVLEVPGKLSLVAGSRGTVRVPKGFYVYAGSARGGLAARIARHRRRSDKSLRWHVDYLRAAAEFRAAYPVRTSQDLECDLARAVRGLAETAGGWEVPRFGSSDCNCPSHLFGFGRNPALTGAFVDLILRARTDRLFP